MRIRLVAFDGGALSCMHHHLEKDRPDGRSKVSVYIESVSVLFCWTIIQAALLYAIHFDYLTDKWVTIVLYGTTAAVSVASYFKSPTCAEFAAVNLLHGLAHYCFPFMNPEVGYDYSNVWPSISWPDLVVHHIQFYLHTQVQHWRKWPPMVRPMVRYGSQVLLYGHFLATLTSILGNESNHWGRIFVYTALLNAIGSACALSSTLFHEENPSSKQVWTIFVVLYTSWFYTYARRNDWFVKETSRLRYYEIAFMTASWVVCGKMYVLDWYHLGRADNRIQAERRLNRRQASERELLFAHFQGNGDKKSA